MVGKGKAKDIAKGLGKHTTTAGGFVALCPAHDDKNPSLSISDGKDGKVLVHCHAGCEQGAVISALKERGLWPERSFETSANIKPRVVAEYNYLDPMTGECVMQVVRYEPKAFKQRRPDGAGGWIWKVGPEHRILYNLPKVARSAGTIFVVEGEKDVETLERINLIATCNPGGAGKWDPRYSEYLRGRDVRIIPDNDDAGRQHARMVANSLRGVAASVAIVPLEGLPPKADISDYLETEGLARTLNLLLCGSPTAFHDNTTPEDREAFAEAIFRHQASRTAPAENQTSFALNFGSDVEIAREMLTVLSQGDPMVHSEGTFWSYGTDRWCPIYEPGLRQFCYSFDGATYGRSSRVRLGTGRINSILNELASMCSQPDFFMEPMSGINCASGFIRFDDDGMPRLEAHSPDHRARHTLPGRWDGSVPEAPPEGSLLQKLLAGCFQGEADASSKIDLLAEIAGVTALGFATRLKQPRAVVLFGQTAENGKSQILDLIRGLLPPSAICSLPVAKMSDERYIVSLAGKLLNASDELSGESVGADTFKAIVTGEPIQGRDVYKSSITFRPQAQHLFATNCLPPFKGGMDRGVQRRLMVVPFSRTIPLDERIEQIGRRIASEEADLLLAWAVAGASRAVRQRGYSSPAACLEALRDWVFSSDMVAAWLDECTDPVDLPDAPGVPSQVAYEHFKSWAANEGYRSERIPAINVFSQRARGHIKSTQASRTSRQRFLRGIRLKPWASY